MSDKKNVGVITEQGFVAGEGLGFKPVMEKEFNPKFNDKEDDKKTKITKEKRLQK